MSCISVVHQAELHFSEIGSGSESDGTRKKKKKKRAVLGSDDESMSKSSASEAGGKYWESICSNIVMRFDFVV